MQSKISFIHPEASCSITLKSGETTNLINICKTITPTCHLNSLLFNGHLQTSWSRTKPPGPLIYYHRLVLEADSQYPGSFTLDFATAPFEDEDPNLFRRTKYLAMDSSSFRSLDCRPMLIVLPGLSGGSHDVYLRHGIAPFLECGEWEVVVLNARGCARSKLTSGILHHGRGTWDLRHTVNWLRSHFPNRALFALGFSLGGNILTNYCGEEGQYCQLKTAVVCSNPFELHVGIDSLQSSFLGKHVYLRSITDIMRQFLRCHAPELSEFLDFDVENINKIRCLPDFDRYIQCLTWGYKTEREYYRDASSTNAISSISIPFIAIQAEDDPVAIKNGLPYEEIIKNPNTVMITTSRGGHIGWFENGGTRWYPKPIFNLLHYVATEVDTCHVKLHASHGARIPLGSRLKTLR